MIRTAGPALRHPIVSLLVLVATCSAAIAQTPAPTAPLTPGGIDQKVKQSNNPQEIRPTVEAFMQSQFGVLAGPDADTQPRARSMIVSEATLMQGVQNTATPVYTDVYCQVLNQQLENLAKNPSLRARLNGAIVLTAVAQVTQNINLRGATLAMLNDANDGVVLWAVKASRSLLPTIVRIKPIDTRLISAVVAAAKAHSKGTCGGAVALEAYDALSLNAADRNVVRQLKPDMIGAVVPAVQELLAFRLTLYQKGIPPEYHAERRPAFFLTDGTIWAAQTPEQRLQTMQLLSDLIALIANQASQPNVSPQDRTELLVTIGVVTRSMHVAATVAQAQGVAAALRPLTDLVDPNAARQLKNDQIVPLVSKVYDALKLDKTFSALKPPPQAVGHEQAPPPASAPTTGPVEPIPGLGAPPPPGAAPPAVAPAPKPTPPAPGAAPKAPPGATAPGAGAAPKAPTAPTGR